MQGLSLSRFRRGEDGAALVEFALVLPALVLFCVLGIEAARTFWSYQLIVSGVRDAARYVGRVAGGDVCVADPTLEGWDEKLLAIVSETVTGDEILPALVEVRGVDPVLTCNQGAWRNGDAAMVRVTATLAIGYPFQGVFAFAGVPLTPRVTTVTDTARVLQ